MSRDVELRTPDADATRAVGAALASALAPGDVVSLTGELGAGKTCFVQGAAAALGVTDRVTSPSFLLRRDYEGKVPVTHMDVYRLGSLQEVLDIGYGESASVVFVEWGDAMRPLLPSDHLEVELLLCEPEAADDGAAPPPGPPPEAEERRILVRPHGDAWRRRLTDLADALGPWRRG